MTDLIPSLHPETWAQWLHAVTYFVFVFALGLSATAILEALIRWCRKK